MIKETKEILVLDSLEIGYGSGRNMKVLLPSLSASAKKGELIAVIGRNGIGKSTLLRTLAGVQESLGGRLYYSGHDIREFSKPELARKVGYISTEIIKVSNMRVYDLVALGRFPHTNWIGRIEIHDQNIIQDALEKTSMNPLSRRFVAELSDGERQKAMIARLLAQNTGIMVMDEPTAFLDVASKYEILHLMHWLSDKEKKTIIFSTHDLQMAVSQSDKIWLMLDDELLEGAPEDLMISGAFSRLFDSSAVIFNSQEGTFSFRSEAKGNIYIEGTGTNRLWTEKAVRRAGIDISDERTLPFISIPTSDNPNWRLSSHAGKDEFPNLYKLITCLKEEMFRSI